MAWNGPSESGRANASDSPQRDRSPRPTRGVIAGTIVVLGAAVAAWWLWPGDGAAVSAKSPSRNGLIKEATPRPREAVPHPARSAADGKAPKALGIPSEGRKPEKRPPEASEGLAPARKTRDPREFHVDNPSDQMLLTVLMYSGGDQPPLPVDPVSKSDFLKSLKSPIVINDFDDARTKLVKELLQDAREEMLVRVEAGESPGDILQSYHDDYNFAEKTRAKVCKEAAEILASGDAEEARRYVAVMNLALQQMDIAPVEDPTEASDLEEEEREE